MAQGLDATKTGARASHEAIETTGGNATNVAETPVERLDHEAMESAKRAQNRIHSDETKLPGSSIFTK
jgi:coenzyme F420-reducing hydrogenase alpha subunit